MTVNPFGNKPAVKHQIEELKPRVKEKPHDRSDDVLREENRQMRWAYG
jgi:hypothetical protein